MNKGFTLVEVLAILIVLCALIVIVSIVAKPVVDTSKENLSDVQIKNIEQAAKVYYLKEEAENYSLELNEIRSCVNVDDLIYLGYIDKDEIMDPEKESNVIGSVKIIYQANNYSYEYQDKKCTNYDMGIICESVKSTSVGNVPSGKFRAGDAYTCKVDPDKDSYKFYVLSTNPDDTVNLIMDRNMCSDGSPTDNIKEDKCLLGLYLNLKDNITDIVEYLQNATNLWVNVPSLNIEYEKESDSFERFNITGKARIPYEEEVIGAGCNGYIGSCPLWLVDNLSDATEDVEYTYPINSISEIYGYWLLFTDQHNMIQVRNDGHIESELGGYGIRPVITLPKSLIK